MFTGEDMGKAFSEEERLLIKKKLQQAALELTREKGLSNFSIREVTRMAGIAQGGFYTFYENKEALFYDLLELRGAQKTKELLTWVNEGHEKELTDPVHFMEELLYYEGMHLKENKAFNNAASDSLHLILNQNEEYVQMVKRQYCEIEQGLIDYWKAHGLCVEIKREQFLAFLRACILLFMNAEWIGNREFPEFFHQFIADGVPNYISVKRISQ